MAEKYILALDQGTTSSRAVIFNRRGRISGIAAREFPQVYPRPGWVEHDPQEIWRSQKEAAQIALRKAGVAPSQIAAVGIANQRETTLVWERKTGRALHNAIVWQCRRTAERCSQIKNTPLAGRVRRKTGLVVDAYFSGTKLEWILKNEKGVRRAAEKGDAVFGTVDTWLAYLLSGKKLHVTDYSNASRTLLFNIHKLAWDREILDFLSIPENMLPAAMPSSGVFGMTAAAEFGGAELPIAGIVGDQQGALFGQTCFREGQSKNTYGTGCFLLMNTGKRPVPSKNNLLTTIAWGIGTRTEYALEGSIFIGGAVIQWLRDGIKILAQASESQGLAQSLRGNEGVYFVPAFVGLGAPHWDMYARGSIFGITRGTTRAHIARAALESIAYQTRDVLECMEADGRIKVRELRVDGGGVANDFLMQFQADILGVPVIVQQTHETTALGAAYLAGLAVGFWRDRGEIAKQTQIRKRYLPAMSLRERETLYRKWKKAVDRAKDWAA